jgi:uncharacterized protein YcfJ
MFVKKLLLPIVALVPLFAAAQETGRVISSTPVVQQVAVQRPVCAPGTVTVPPQTSGLGGLMGAIAGAALGSQIGSGDGRIAATVIGTVGGALLGNSVEGGGAAQVQQTQNCTTQVFHENRTVGYNVTYEYAGRQYTVQMPYDPGPTIQLQVTPVDAGQRPAGPGAPLVTAPPVSQTEIVAPTVTHTIVQPAPLHTVVYPSYAYSYPAYSYGYWPSVSLSLGYSNHHRHYRHSYRGYRNRFDIR